MPARRKQLVAEEPCGSSQSAASLAADKAAQPRLFAAAAARKGISKNNKSSKERMRLLDFKSLVTSSPSSAAPSSTPRKGDKAVFTLMKAKYMKGERAGTYSGSIYFQGKPTYGNNQTFKDKVHPKLISETLRWTDDVKLYSAKIYTYEQAVMVLDAMRQVSEQDEKDLADVKVDATIFEDANEAKITILPIEVDGELNLAVGGTTYPFAKKIKDEGFQFHKDVNGHTVKLWLRREAEAHTTGRMDANDLEAMFEEYGFTVEIYDGIDDEQDEDEDA